MEETQPAAETEETQPVEIAPAETAPEVPETTTTEEPTEAPAETLPEETNDTTGSDPAPEPADDGTGGGVAVLPDLTEQRPVAVA